jgi:hypothetical protein
MFLAWAAQHQLLNDFHEQRSATLVAQLRNRQITGREFFEAACRSNSLKKI